MELLRAHPTEALKTASPKTHSDLAVAKNAEGFEEERKKGLERAGLRE